MFSAKCIQNNDGSPWYAGKRLLEKGKVQNTTLAYFSTPQFVGQIAPLGTAFLPPIQNPQYLLPSPVQTESIYKQRVRNPNGYKSW